MDDQASFAQQEDEINFRDLLAILIQYKNSISLIIVISIIASVALALLMTPIYRSDVLLAPVKEQDAAGGLASLTRNFGGLTSLVGGGVDLGSGDEKAFATLTSRAFITSFIESKNLLPILFHEQWDQNAQKWKEDSEPATRTLWFGYERFRDLMIVSKDKLTGLVSFSIEWRDPKLAAEWANELIAKLNAEFREDAISQSRKNIEFLRAEIAQTSFTELKTSLFELMQEEMKRAMLANSNEEFVYEVIDRAVVSEQRIRPKRKVIVLLGAALGLLVALTFVFTHYAMFAEKR